MAAIPNTRLIQLVIRNPKSKPGHGIHFSTTTAKQLLGPHIKMDSMTGLSISTSLRLDFFQRPSESTILGILENDNGRTTTSCDPVKISDLLRNIFTGINTGVFGIVEIDDRAKIGSNCFISGSCLGLTPGSHQMEETSTYIKRYSTIGDGISIIACGIDGLQISGSKEFDGETNPFSIFQASILRNLQIQGRFATMGSRISDLRLSNTEREQFEIDGFILDGNKFEGNQLVLPESIHLLS